MVVNSTTMRENVIVHCQRYFAVNCGIDDTCHVNYYLHFLDRFLFTIFQKKTRI